jgi:hypothetical protein
MAATPLEHAGELAPATKWTDEPEVLPLIGELTETPAKEGRAKTANRHTNSKHLLKCISYISQTTVFLKAPNRQLSRGEF